MKGLEKLTCIRLAEILTQKGAVPSEVLTDALYAQDRHDESFVEFLVSSGHITEWDLAKIVVDQFQMPFLTAGNYSVEESVRSVLSKETMFRNLIVPLDRFHDVLTVSMPILTPNTVLRKISDECKCSIFPYIGLPSENRRLLTEMFSDFPEFSKQMERELEEKRKKFAAKKKKRGDGQGDDWMNIFDTGDAQVRDSIG